jgi:hypothetical protein
MARRRSPTTKKRPVGAVPRLLKEKCPIWVVQVRKKLGPVLKSDMKWYCKGFIMVQKLWQYTVPFRRYNRLKLHIYTIIITSTPAMDWKMFEREKRVPKARSAIFWKITQLIGPIGCPETSVRNYRYTLRNFPEECTSHVLRGTGLKSRKLYLESNQVSSRINPVST